MDKSDLSTKAESVRVLNNVRSSVNPSAPASGAIVDCTDWNSVEVDVILSGSYTGTVEIYGNNGGAWLQEEHPNASQAVTQSRRYTVLNVAQQVTAGVSSISGSGDGGITVILTPLDAGSAVGVSIVGPTTVMANQGANGADAWPVDTELPAASALADATANPTAPEVGAALEGFNGTTWDLLRTIAASGAGLGVLKTGTLGEAITLHASAAETASANGTPVTGLGWRKRYLIVLDVTAAASLGTDTLDAYVDVSIDGAKWLNAAHFAQILGNGGAKTRFAVLEATSPGTSDLDATADAAAGTVRPTMSGLPQMRARWAIAGGGAQSFTFSLTGWAI